MGGVQNFEWSNVERPIFRNFKITNTKAAKDESFDYFIYEFIFYEYFVKSIKHSKYFIIFPNYIITIFLKLTNSFEKMKKYVQK